MALDRGPLGLGANAVWIWLRIFEGTTAAEEVLAIISGDDSKEMVGCESPRKTRLIEVGL